MDSLRRMATYLHTMVRVTDPARSREFYEALGFTFSREMDIVRNGEREATNYFFSIGDSPDVLELTFNHDGRTYELGTAYGHVAIGVDDLDGTLARLAEQGIEPERPPYTVREARGSASSGIRTPTGSRSSRRARPRWRRSSRRQSPRPSGRRPSARSKVTAAPDAPRCSASAGRTGSGCESGRRSAGSQGSVGRR